MYINIQYKISLYFGTEWYVKFVSIEYRYILYEQTSSEFALSPTPPGDVLGLDRTPSAGVLSQPHVNLCGSVGADMLTCPKAAAAFALLLLPERGIRLPHGTSIFIYKRGNNRVFEDLPSSVELENI